MGGAEMITKLRLVFPLLLMISPLMEVPSGRQPAEADLRFNDQLYIPDTGEILLAPGGPNIIRVELGSWTPRNGDLRVIATRTLPDGRQAVVEKNVDRGKDAVQLDIGPLTAPPQYEFDSGVVYQRGYRLSLRVQTVLGKTLAHWDFSQGLTKAPAKGRQGMGETWSDVRTERIRLLPGIQSRVVFNPRFGALGPLALRLGEEVLFAQDRLRILARLNPAETPEKMTCLLRVLAPDGTELSSKTLELDAVEGWEEHWLQPGEWPAGRYRVELLPEIDGIVWPDGPSITYTRRHHKKDLVLVSPLAPWTLVRDTARKELRIHNFREAHKRWGEGKVDHSQWHWSRTDSDGSTLKSQGNYKADPIVYRLPTDGTYAVFASVNDYGGIIQVGGEGLVRAIRPQRLGRDSFVSAADLTGEAIKIYPTGDPKSALVSLRLVPVTEESVRAFYEEIANPVLPLYGISDWTVYFGPPWSRLLPDQYETLVCALAEIGIRTNGWAVGRSWVTYHSELPNTTMFPCVPLEQARKKFAFQGKNYASLRLDGYQRWVTMLHNFAPLPAVYRHRRPCQVEIWPWLAMQRHYGTRSHGGIFACPFYRGNPQWWRIAKNGKDSVGLSYFFPEVRKERVDILVEVATRGADGLVVGCNRQVPMLLYNPEMVKAYQSRTSVDPTKIDASNPEAYEEWISWRADFFSRVLRELKRRLQPLRSESGRSIPVAVRMPSSGLFFNLAQGLDVERWCREGLVDQLQLAPLEDLGGSGDHDLRPYVHLARRHGISVIGGIGSTAFHLGRGESAYRPDGPFIRKLGNVVAGLRRALSLSRAGVDGIEVYEIEMMALVDQIRFLIPLYGMPGKLEEFLQNSNLEACFPLDATTAVAGYDNHSRWSRGWEVSGSGAKAL